MNLYDIKKLVKVIIFSIIFAMSINFFLIPINLISTGIAGIAQIISDVSALDYGIFYLLLNIPGIILGLTKLGSRFTIYSIVSILTVTIASSIIPTTGFTDDVIINCIFGGIFMGYALGNLLKIGTSSGGTDFYGIWIEQKFQKSFSSFNLLLNLFIISVAAFLYGIDIALYTLLSFYIRNLTMQQIFVNNEKMTVWIIGDDLTRVSTYINQVIGHGTTIIKATGGYTQEDKQVIMTILTHYEYSLLCDAITVICPNAFMNVTETTNIFGNFTAKKRAN